MLDINQIGIYKDIKQIWSIKKMTKTHINDTSSMYRVSDIYNHKGFIHWNENKKYTGESISSTNANGEGYKIYDLIDDKGYIYYEVYKIGLSKNKKELDETNDILLLTTYDNKKVGEYINRSFNLLFE